MKVLAVGAAKGGVGKTTTSLYLAARAAEMLGSTRERPLVALIDRDESKNLTMLWKRRADLRRPDIVLWSDSDLPPDDAGFQFVVIDTPPGLSAIPSLREAALVLVPTVPEDQGVNNLINYLHLIDVQRLAASPQMRLVAVLPTIVKRRTLHQVRLEEIKRIAAMQKPPLLVLPSVPDRARIALPDLTAPEYDTPIKELFRYAEILDPSPAEYS